MRVLRQWTYERLKEAAGAKQFILRVTEVEWTNRIDNKVSEHLKK